MLNLALTVILADQRRRQCPCGAVADRPFGLCRKCQDRKSWRRKAESTHRRSTYRKTGRRRFARRVHGVAALAVLLINNGLGV
jgi:hypothetical protein